MGVFYGAALTEAATYRGEDVCIVGGANSAGQAGMFISRYAKSVTMLIRGESLKRGMSHYLSARIAATPNITVMPHVEVESVGGNDKLDWVKVKHCETSEVIELPMRAMFIFIGAAPHSEMAEG